MRATIYLSLGELTQAENDAQKVNELSPNSALSYRTFGQNFYLQGRYSEAKEMFIHILNLQLDQALDMIFLGQTYYRLGEYEAVIECLKPVSSKNPTAIMAHYYLGRSFEKLGNQKRADETFKVMRRFGEGLEELKIASGCWPKDYSEIQLLQEDILNIEQRLNMGFRVF
ncbi:MAG: tetratricopeptide repeat protein [Deltaproteobacteria bacterium]|nr:tetratricopeptide repeat protein [Deltaproteobacteria bacterium]